MFELESNHVVIFENSPMAIIATVINIHGDFVEIRLDEKTCVVLSRDELKEKIV